MSRQEIVIPNHVTLQSVESWRFGQQLELSVSSAPTFDPGVMGITMATLNYFLNSGAEISLVLQKSLPEKLEELERSVWGTPLGFFFLLFASDANVAGRHVRLDGIKKLCWEYYQKNRGAIGRGNQVHWVSIDPAIPLPPILPAGVENDFPKPSDFNELIKDSANKLTSAALSTITEAPIISFIYETARNSMEHGRISGPDERVRGIRSISFERMTFASVADLEQRKMPLYYKTYIKALFKQPEFDKQILCINVIDQGPGITRTLPIVKGETPLNSLIRAFGDGQSRKPLGVANRGHGLSKVLFAAQKLEAFMQIYSSGLFVYQDFLNQDDKYPTLNPSIIQDISENIQGGTVLSLLVPQFLISPDQKNLFPVPHG